MADVQISDYNTFGFIDNKTLLAKAVMNGKIEGISLQTNYKSVNITGQEFFEAINDPKNSKD